MVEALSGRWQDKVVVPEYKKITWFPEGAEVKR